MSLRPTVYIVLRCTQLSDPARFSTYTAFKRAVGALEHSDYSGQEEEGPVPPAKKAPAKAKRLTANQLSEQVSSLATLLPGLIDQVKAVVERQDRMEAGAIASRCSQALQQPSLRISSLLFLQRVLDFLCQSLLL